MKDHDCIQFLQWSLPRLRMRWQGFRKVRGQVCKRIHRRLNELGLTDISAYYSYLDDHADEWTVLDGLCRVTISRFYRDRQVFQSLERVILAKLAGAAIARGEKELCCWSIGCASGEEPYTLAILWRRLTSRRFPSLGISILATDADKNMIERAENGCYAAGSLADLPLELRNSAFDRQGDLYCIKPDVREKVVFLEQDVRAAGPDGLFHLILCRNLAFTYFDADLQREVLAHLTGKLQPQGVVVVGIHESLPSGAAGFTPLPGYPGVYVKGPEVSSSR